MYNKNKTQSIKESQLEVNESVEGESIEEKLIRIMENNEGIDEISPQIFQEYSEGVNPAFDIRTDRFEIALEGVEAINKSRVAKREAKVVELNKKTEENGESTGSSQ